MEWGNVAEWVAALGTIGAAAIALHVLRAEIRQRDERLEIERSAQAGQVYVFEPSLATRLENPYKLGLNTEWLWASVDPYLVIENKSDSPISNVEVAMAAVLADRRLVRWTGRARRVEAHTQKHMDLVATQHIPIDTHERVVRLIANSVTAATVTFKDSAGREWMRDPDHTLIPRSTAALGRPTRIRPRP